MLKLNAVHFSYECEGEAFSVITTKSLWNEEISLTLRTEGDIFSVFLHTGREIKIKFLKAVFSCPLREEERIFLNGYQSWTDSREHGIHGRMHGIERIPAPVVRKYAFSQYGDYHLTDYSGKSGELHGFSYGYIRNGENYRLIGSLNEATGFTILRTDTAAQQLTAEKECAGLHVSGDYSALHLLLTEGTEQNTFDTYFRLLNVKPRENSKPVSGYTSWYRHYQNINEQILLKDLAGMQKQNFPADVFQIDDGWQTAVGDWLSIDTGKFPDGFRSLVPEIRNSQFTAGLWLAPFVCEEKSEIFQHHKDWLVYDKTGNPVKGGSNWSGFYALDFYHPDVRNYLKQVLQTVIQEWGFGLVKLDFLYAVCIEPRPDKSRGQIMAEAMQFLRECVGDALLLGCGVPLASAFGLADYCRVGCDVGLDWDDKPYMRLMHRERVSTKNTILNTVFRRQLSGRAFWNDPDVYLLRTEQNALTWEQKRCLAEVNALCGDVLFTSDNTALYEETQQKMTACMKKLRECNVISAEYDGKFLKIRFRHGDKIITGTWQI